MGVERLGDLSKTILLDGAGQYTTAPVIFHGVDQTFSVTLGHGRKKTVVRATADHDWVVGMGKVKTRDLKKGTHIPFVYHKPASDDMAVVHGLIFGDGTATKDSGYVLHVCSEHEATYPLLDKFNFPYSETERGRLYYFFGRNIHTLCLS